MVDKIEGCPFNARVEGKVRYHAGASLASNALVSLIAQARDLMSDVGLEPDAAVQALLPLVRSTLDNIETEGLEAALTGPVRRGDAATVRLHLKELPYGAARESYVALARLSLELARKAGLDEQRAAMIEAVLVEV